MKIVLTPEIIDSKDEDEGRPRLSNNPLANS